MAGPVWLEPWPDDVPASAPDDAHPAANYLRRESVELAFVAALQHLPGTQRAVLILRDVLEFSAPEVARILDTTPASVNSAMQRARKAVRERVPGTSQQAELDALGADGRRELVDAFVAAWERADVPAPLDLLAEDARFTMPPLPAWFLGRTDVGRFLTERMFATPWRLVPMSLDCHYEGPARNVMVLPLDGAFDAYNVERLRAADTLLLGRSTYEGFKGFWPTVADDPDASPNNREISRLDNAIAKVVVSDTITPEQTEPWRDTTRIVRRAAAYDEIAEPKQPPGNDILVFGSRTLWNDLLAHHLVDELHLMIGSVVLGAGTPLFNGPPGVTLRPVDTRRWTDSTNLLVKYDVTG